MLAVQVDYWKLQETARHNVVQEQQTWESIAIDRFNAEENKRHNIATEELGWYNAGTERGKLAETARHNQASEALESEKVKVSWANLAEVARHNLQTEDLGWANLGETSRHNRQQEAIGFANIAETRRHNQETEWQALENWRVAEYEAETKRSAQQAQESYWNRMADVSEQNLINSFFSVTANTQNANTNAYRALTDYDRYVLEQIRLGHDVKYDWARFGQETAKNVSQETRNWFNMFLNYDDGDK